MRSANFMVGILFHLLVLAGCARIVRELRAAHSMTQQELADRISVTRQTVIAIEGDKYSPSLEIAFRIAHVFGVPLENVFQYDPPRRTKH